jgi:hypothetical protein
MSNKQSVYNDHKINLLFSHVSELSQFSMDYGSWEGCLCYLLDRCNQIKILFLLYLREPIFNYLLIYFEQFNFFRKHCHF